MLGWHFLAEDRKLRYGDGRVVRDGRTYTAKGPLVMCQNGVHASKKVLDALTYAPGPIVCRVELSGKILHETDKSVARTRRVLWLLDATNILHEFACRCAEDVLRLAKNPDPRSVAAIEAKRSWMAGKISSGELVAARDAAWDAARGAAWGAAWDAAWDAARGAAWEAARNAARVAAWGAAWDAERVWQADRLAAYLNGATS